MPWPQRLLNAVGAGAFSVERQRVEPALALAVAAGILFRLLQYLDHLSLWYDEAALALNILNRSFEGLLQPLAYNQAAPVGFLTAEKAVTHLLGTGEYALRLIPLLAGVLSVYLFYRLAERVLSKDGALIATVLFAALGPLIRYAAEVKPYSVDAFFSVLLLLLALQQGRGRTSARRRAGLAFTGAVAVWFSLPAVFVLGGIAAAWTAFEIRDGKWRNAVRKIPLYAVWLISFAGHYLLTIRSAQQNDVLQQFWSNSFMPFPPSSAADLLWFPATFFDVLRGMFDNPVTAGGMTLPHALGLAMSGLAAVALVSGILVFWRRGKEVGLLLVAPVLLALLASAFRLYPFDEHLLLFAVPLFLLFLAAGASQFLPAGTGPPSVAGWAFVGVFLALPVGAAVHDAVTENGREELRPVLRAVNDDLRPSDSILVYYAAEPAFRYYAARFGLPMKPGAGGNVGNARFGRGERKLQVNYLSESRDDWSGYLRQVGRMELTGRTWVLFSHVFGRCEGGYDEAAHIAAALEERGQALEVIRRMGASAYLFELGDNARSARPVMPQGGHGPEGIARCGSGGRDEGSRRRAVYR